ncbi:NUDIX domain-containing protein [uncultured Thioclava sp.]|uniref:NUDIX domain-containing protein n=1 Tax=uncultured Thioclava sp. TaxID=473858 RepID=UPI0025D96C06|nr:NUDIX domain-containing protein [uncultured Thioclava sp.]
MSIHHFFYGTLCHPPLLHAVIGRVPDMQPASLCGYRVREACRDDVPLGFPVLEAQSGATAQGFVCMLSPREAERIAWYEAGYHAQDLDVVQEGASLRARVWLPGAGHWQLGEEWSLAEWRPHWGALKTEAAAQFIREAEQIGPEAANARYHSILVRAWSKLAAQAQPMPQDLRRSAQDNDIDVDSQSIGYQGFFLVEDYKLRHRLFAGGFSDTLNRAAFVSGDAAVVLPYDARRDRVLLIEQFRTGPFARGEPNPWMIEAIAGRIDPGESPKQTAHREAMEEAGITLDSLIEAPRFYPTPGAKTEFIHCFIGLTDLPDDAGRPGGVEDEGEDIRPHLVSFDQLMEMVQSGEAGNAPLVVLALWLERMRDGLRAKA